MADALHRAPSGWSSVVISRWALAARGVSLRAQSAPVVVSISGEMNVQPLHLSLWKPVRRKEWLVPRYAPGARAVSSNLCDACSTSKYFPDLREKRTIEPGAASPQVCGPVDTRNPCALSCRSGIVSADISAVKSQPILAPYIWGGIRLIKSVESP